MSTEQTTQNKKQASDIRKAKMSHFANGFVDAVDTMDATAVIVVAAVVAVAVVAAGAVAAIVGAVATVAGVSAAVGAVSGAAAAVGAKYEPYKHNISGAVADKFKAWGKVLGFTLPVAAGIAAGVAFYNVVSKTEAPPVPVPVTAAPTKTATITCPAETMEALTNRFNQDHDTSLTIPGLKEADCTMSSSHSPAP